MEGVAQMLVVNPALTSATIKLVQLFGYAQSGSSLRWRLWMHPRTVLPEDSPWQAWSTPATQLSQPHPAPALLVLNSADDWRLARQIYGRRLDLPKLHLVTGADLRDWGHGAAQESAVRLVLGEEIAQVLRQQRRFVEPLETLPVCLDPDQLPAPLPQKQGCLILASSHPALGLAVQQGLRAQGHSCRCELSPWSWPRRQQAMAEAAVVVVLSSPEGQPGLGLRRLTAMALGAALVVDTTKEVGWLRDGRNALARLPQSGELVQAVGQLLGDPGLRERLVQGGKATLLRYRTALERLRFLDLLAQLPSHWQSACEAHQSVATSGFPEL